jgi:hypothetical protein
MISQKEGEMSIKIGLDIFSIDMRKAPNFSK